MSLSQRAAGISTPSGSGRDIDTFGALHKSLRTAAIASLKDGVAEGSFALGMPRGRSRAKESTRPASPEGKAGDDFGVGRPRRNESMSLKTLLAFLESDLLQFFEIELRHYRSNGSV